MFEGERVLAVVPARGGSKRFPHKNTFPLCGKPLIVWTLEAAQGCGHIDEILVSTDSPSIASICTAHGFAVPALRPAELATDTARTADVVRHHLTERNDVGWVVLLQPTSPLRLAADIDDAFATLARTKAQRVVSVRRLPVPPSWMHVVSEEGVLTPLLSDSPCVYVPDGLVYVARREDVLSGYDFSCAGARAVESDSRRNVDVDTLEDMHEAEVALRGRT